MSMRALVLNADYSLLNVTDHWFDGVKLLLKGAATAAATYDRAVRSEKGEHEVPAVLIRRTYAHVGRRRHGFTLPSHKNIFIREQEKCAYCGCKLTLRTTTKEHVIPRSKGGPDTLLNVVAACRSCNGLKADRTLSDSGMKLRDTVQMRHLTEEEKLSVLLKFHEATERKAWLGFLNKTGLTLF